MKKKNIIALTLLLLLCLIGIATLCFVCFFPNTNQKQTTSLTIPKNADFQQVKDSIQKHNILKNNFTFELCAKLMKYNNIRCGKYRIEAGENNKQIISKLRRGQHRPVKFTFNNVRTKEQLANKVGNLFFFDSNDLLVLLNDSTFLQKYGFSKENCMVVFIPNTYEIYYDITAQEFFEKMLQFHNDFWNKTRTEKSNIVGLSPIEVSILASIVEEENHRNAEKAIIAGLYINRLHKKMNLCSDPTVKFAVGDFSLKRILNTHLEIESPYNTYKHPGLPPGPIRIPEISSIDSVLNYTHHNYLYMCAKEDLSGYHNFAVTAQQHQINAKKYHRALNKIRL